MIRYIRGIAGCMGGRHERSEAKIRRLGEDYYSHCRYCRAPMRRVGKRNWVIDRAAAGR